MIKRLFDFLCSLAGLIILSPAFLIISLWVFFDSPGGVFFRQVRVGLHGKEFRIYKFRTMSLNAEVNGKLTIGHDIRITRPGHFLRKYKIDELPQLIDVLLGRMSLVGPRPEVPEFMNCYSNEVKNKVLSVKPGITDLASIEMVDENLILSDYDDARKAYIDIILPIKQRFYIDYVDNNSFFGDLKIIFKTLLKIIR
ncbi:sugar transferase [Photobacterium swingsii]|uniref:sugar transferase n=1 Tax=Photobacterium swingsii TaxID=680026 RepID=UPI0040698EF9